MEGASQNYLRKRQRWGRYTPDPADETGLDLHLHTPDLHRYTPDPADETAGMCLPDRSATTLALKLILTQSVSQQST